MFDAVVGGPVPAWRETGLAADWEERSAGSVAAGMTTSARQARQRRWAGGIPAAALLSLGVLLLPAAGETQAPRGLLSSGAQSGTITATKIMSLLVVHFAEPDSLSVAAGLAFRQR